ncbi:MULTISPECIES: VOC family protein [unclassified Pseudoalteromonas]|uniref:VOC family protein n=1 Tax=unclassified Pseudoalteromonas TaxID=194690 RepID=UPI0016045787|nr:MULTISPECIES: VOC family protein [unclassified Pseudoalteromonas]MBB1398521.1 glyoxalase [Pseudoalteromonas sp. SG44-8]MBB1409949.1 glyoxalase [Pseudoalteromonas sp. SG44-17]
MELINQVIYVDNVEETLDFYYQAFGFGTHTLSDDAEYGELATGDIKIAFANHPSAQAHFKQGYIRAHPKQPALGFELRFSCTNLSESYDKAVLAGAEPLCPPSCRGTQYYAYVRAIEGTLICLVQA